MPATAQPTKSQILQVSRSLFSIHGYKNTSIEDIITAAGVMKGAFYHYFKSKQALCHAVIDQVQADYEQLIEQLPADAEPIEVLKQILNKLAQLNASGRWVNCRLLLQLSGESHESQPVLQEKLNDFWQWYLDFYENLIRRCRAAGQIKTDISPKIQTSLLVSLLAGAIAIEKINHSPATLTDMIETIIKTLQT